MDNLDVIKKQVDSIIKYEGSCIYIESINDCNNCVVGYYRDNYSGCNSEKKALKIATKLKRVLDKIVDVPSNKKDNLVDIDGKSFKMVTGDRGCGDCCFLTTEKSCCVPKNYINVCVDKDCIFSKE